MASTHPRIDDASGFAHEGADLRGPLIGALVMVVGIVTSAPLSAVEYGFVSVVALSAAAIYGISLPGLLMRSLMVLPVAGTLALFGPLRFASGTGLEALVDAYATGWPDVLATVATAWLCAVFVLGATRLGHAADVVVALDRLRVPAALTLLLSFIVRYVDVLNAQVVSMRRAIRARGSGLTRRGEVALYGNLAGSLILRAHDRGERVHAAMRARGFDGRLPAPPATRTGLEAVAPIAVALLCALALGIGV